MHGKLCNSLWGGEASSDPNFSTQEHKEKNTCTGFHISLLHILTSLLTDSNNQDTRIHTSASSTSFLKDSSYWFLITLPSWSLKQAREGSGNIQEKVGSKRQLQADPTTQEVSPWLQGLARLSISQHISKRLQGLPSFRITTWQRGTVKLQKACVAELNPSSSLQPRQGTVQCIITSTRCYSTLKSTLLDEKPEFRGQI